MPIINETYASLNGQSETLLNDYQTKRKTRLVSFYTAITRDLVSNFSAWTKVPKSDSYENTDVIIHSSGGDADAAYHLGILLSDMTKGKLSFIVPRYAKSAATLLCCAGDEIVMFDAAELGPLDPQIIRKDGTSFSALSLKAMLDLLNKESKAGNTQAVEVLAKKLDPLDLGEIERTLGISKKYASSLLIKRMFKGKAEDDADIVKISKKLSEGYTHHGYLIDINEALQLGLKVSKPDSDLERRVGDLAGIQDRLAELPDIDRKLNEYGYLKQKI